MTRFRRHTIILLLAVASVMFFAVGPASWQSFSLITITFTQGLDSLVNTGTLSLIPNGWYFGKVGTRVNVIFATGMAFSIISGGTYSYWMMESTYFLSNNEQ